MDRRAATMLAIGMIACGSRPTQQPLYAAGSDKDDGHGMLARASSQLMTSDEAEPALVRARPRRGDDEAAHVDEYGGAMYGGGGYGGASYASYVPPAWGYPNVNRLPAHSQKAGLSAAIEGTITWRGAPPKLTTACGAIAPLQIGAGRALAGVLVYIERVSIGRALPHGSGEQRPATVGGVVIKRGCAFAPTTQIVTPVPAALAVHGDARRTRVAITASDGVTRASDLQEAGRITVQAQPGVTRIESADGTLGAAWVIGLETPAYAITDDAGRFRIDELAAGTYELTIWQAPIPTVVAGKLVYGPPVIAKRSIKVDLGRPARVDHVLGR